MLTTLSIGDFARATHLSVKTLRFYHAAGLLEPVAIDPYSSYRRYGLDQIPTAQVIRRFRDLAMPIEDIRQVLRAGDLDERNELIAAHLGRLEPELQRTQKAANSLRELLQQPRHSAPVVHRHVPAMRVMAVREVVSIADLGAWYRESLGELYTTLTAHGAEPAGSAGGVYADALFQDERGQAVVYLQAPGSAPATGRIEVLDLPAADLAVVTHDGGETDIDRAYGALADYVARHALAIDGPIREFYPVNFHHVDDPVAWRTEIGWPIFAIGPTAPPPR